MNKGISFFAFFLYVLLAVSCTKTVLPEIEKDGQVQMIRYACGPSCDAAMWSVVMDGKYYYPSTTLADSFKVHGLQVSLRYKLTGEFFEAWSGPTGTEMIEIINIRKR